MLKTSILILSLFLSGCVLTDPKDPWPIKRVLALDLQHGVFGEKEISITSDNKLLFSHVQDVPTVVHDGAICFWPEDFLSGKHWIERHIETDKQGRK